MSAETAAIPQTPPAVTESKSARKKKAKAEAASTAVPTVPEANGTDSSHGGQLNDTEGSDESSFVKEIHK